MLRTSNHGQMIITCMTNKSGLFKGKLMHKVPENLKLKAKFASKDLCTDTAAMSCIFPLLQINYNVKQRV